MSTENKSASFDEILGANATRYDHVEAYGVNIRIGSLCSADMIEWLESNDDKAKGRLSGIRMLVKSLVDDNGKRLPGVEEPDKFEKYVTDFSQKDATENGKVVRAVLKLNGLDRAKAVADALKNDSSEAPIDASPTGSALKLAERT